MTLPHQQAITQICLNVHDLEGVAAFYIGALGFSEGADEGAGRTRLRLGAEEIVLIRQPPEAPAYPQPRAANDPWFQHFAIAVSDMESAYARLERYNAAPISTGGPQQLPPSTGSVIAYKFRDPEGHPLELSYIPGSAWLTTPGRDERGIFLGIDHTALASQDLDASAAFYRGLGFLDGPRFLNTGVEQDRLDGLLGVELDIAVLSSPGAGPHIELLHYRAPSPAPRTARGSLDIAASQTVLQARSPMEIGTRSDPDGHLITLAL
jgi:catechol 2,3-dioxygenase-like lactoylglutathione lyase family enzyme